MAMGPLSMYKTGGHHFSIMDGTLVGPEIGRLPRDRFSMKPCLAAADGFGEWEGDGEG
jgi:hypothetical protein